MTQLYQDINDQEKMRERWVDLHRLPPAPPKEPHKSGDWIRDFASIKAFIEWRIANREYPSPCDKM
jgi:hypothetical protein